MGVRGVVPTTTGGQDRRGEGEKQKTEAKSSSSPYLGVISRRGGKI
jgi:hypothetical protein